jgi:hypothetical protein
MHAIKAVVAIPIKVIIRIFSFFFVVFMDVF